MPATPRPSAYRTISNQLRSAVASGLYADGVQLPTEAELAEQHRVSRQTVRRAMQELVSEGVVYRVAGRGTFATPRGQNYVRHIGSVEDLLGLSDDTDLQVVSPLRRRIDL